MRVRSELQEDGTLLQLTVDAQRGNVLDIALMGELRAALDGHRSSSALRLVLLRSTGADFSFGVSVPEHRREVVGRMLPAFHALVRDVASFPVPVAALVQGRCLGGAFELVLACHFVLARPGARFACPEIKLGVFPPVLAVLGALRLGGALAERLLLTGEEVGADTLAGIAVADDAAVLEWYRARLRPSSAFALREAVAVGRRPVLEALGAPLDAAERHYLERIATSHDGNEGLAAFTEKRPAAWQER